MIDVVDTANNRDIVVAPKENTGAFKPLLVPAVGEREFGITRVGDRPTVLAQRVTAVHNEAAASVEPGGRPRGFPQSIHNRVKAVDASGSYGGLSLTGIEERPSPSGLLRPTEDEGRSSMKATKPGEPGHPAYPQRPAAAERVVHQEPLSDGAARDRGRPALGDATPETEAVGAALFRAHDAARHLENLLELEAASDGRVAALHWRAKGLRKSITVLLVDALIEAVALE